LIERINLRLSTDSQNRKESRMTGSPSFGHFYENTNSIADIADSIDLESFGRQLGVLMPGETIANHD
jgi:hypothetical protein